MKRHVSFLLRWMVLMLLAHLTVGASTAFAKTGKCMVINDRINTTYKSANPLQDAIDEASPWDTIWIRGVCRGPVEITKSLTLEGKKTPGYLFAPTIMGWVDNFRDPLSVVYVHGSDVQVQINSLIVTRGGGFMFAVERGGGILNEEAELTLNDVTITDNHAIFGGGIFNDGGTVELNDSTIELNTARQGWGGGIFTQHGTLILNASTITHNQWALFGGGIYAWVSTVVAYESEIAHNYAENDIGTNKAPHEGGGIDMYSNYDDPWGTLTLTDTRIYDNWAVQGGGIYVEKANVTVTGSSELSGNHAEKIGGGAFVYGNLVVSGDTRIRDNTAGNPYLYPGWGPGGGVAFFPGESGKSFTMSGNATIYDNTAVSDGGGIFGNSAYLAGCIAGTEGDEGVNVFNNLPNDIHD